MGHALAALLALAIGAGDPDGNYIVPGTRGAIVYRRAGGQELKLTPRPVAPAPPRGGGDPRRGGTSGSRVAFAGCSETLTRAGYNWFPIDYWLGGTDRRAEARRCAALASSGRTRPTSASPRAHAPAHAGRPGREPAAEKPAGVRAVALIALRRRRRAADETPRGSPTPRGGGGADAPCPRAGPPVLREPDHLGRALRGPGRERRHPPLRELAARPVGLRGSREMAGARLGPDRPTTSPIERG